MTPKKPIKPINRLEIPPVEIPSPIEVEKPRRKRGSGKGKLNIWERLYAFGKSAGVLAVTLLVALAEQVKDALPVIKQSSPIWIGILIGGFAGTVIYLHEAHVLRSEDNTGVK